MASRIASVSAAVVLGFGLLGCSDDGDSHPHEEGGPSVAGLDDVVYVGRTTDEALAYMLDRTAEDSEAQRMVFVSPEAGAVLSRDEPTPLTFNYAITGQLERRRAVPVHTTPTWRDRALRDLRQLLGPIREAHAHGTPFNGVAYFLTLTDVSGDSVLRIFTDETTYAADATVWSALADAPQPLTASVISGIFEGNKVLSDGGPYVGASVEFSIE